ncbi:hypothetical protein [Zhihengliuella sp. ISTPL4]|uniref:hypothetical protein n=1 Tax=Zhihengliuella sp. ISTPL4 TaxID=2058657 RepID=UPI00256FE428|nr:hypothetical protein [Zhihengliuella sp. ISTPL4]
MTALDELFPDGPRADRETPAAREAASGARLRALVGAPRSRSPRAAAVADTRELARRAEAAARSAVPFAAVAPTVAGEAPRRRRRLDPLSMSAAALAAIAVISAVTVGGIQAATASPAASALESLQADEATIQNAHQGLTATRDGIISDIAAQTSEVTALRAALLDTATIPDPLSSESAVLDVTDPSPRQAAVAALETYLAGLAAIDVPEAPTEYRRGEVDEDSLVEVGGAIDAAQERLETLDRATADMRAVRGTLDALRPAAAPVLAVFADSFVPSAESATDERPGAEESFRVAVTQTAGVAAAADPWTAEGQTAYAAYRDAFRALVDDQLRAEREEADRRTEEQQPNFPQNPQNGGTTPPDPVESPAPTEPDTQDGEGSP